MEISFDQLPKAVSHLSKELGEIKQLLLDRYSENQPVTNAWLDLNELCIYLPDKPAKATVYGWVHQGRIPFHKGGKKLRFLRSEIDEWLNNSGTKKQ